MTACSRTTAWWVPGRIRLLYLQPLSWYRNSRDSHPGRHSFFYDPRNRGRSEAVSDTTHLGIQYSLSDLEDVRQHFRHQEDVFDRLVLSRCDGGALCRRASRTSRPGGADWAHSTQKESILATVSHTTRSAHG